MANTRKIFSRIYDENVEKIYRFIFFKVSSQEIAQDLTSETFLRGWEAFQKGSEEIKNPRAFLYQISRNLIVDHYRLKAKTQTIPIELASVLPDPRPTLDERAALNSDMDNVKFALSKINDDYREIITWYYIDDLPIQEIAQMLGKTEGAARVTLHRALSALKNEVSEA